MNVRVDLITKGTKRRSGIKMDKVRFLVAHDTGNDGSTASGNVNYYKNSANEISASAHYFVDDKEIVLCVPENEKAWHVIYDVNTDNKMYGHDANDSAIGVELCFFSKDKKRSKTAYDNYVQLFAELCVKFKLNPRKDIVGHDVLDPRRKVDPKNALSKIGLTFKDFIEDVVKQHASMTAGVTPTKPTPPTDKVSDEIGEITILTDAVNIREKADLKSKIVAVALKNQKYKVYQVSNDMYKISDKKWITSNAKYTKLKKKEAVVNNTLYRVIIGSFKDRDNANAFVLDLGKKKIDAFTIVSKVNGKDVYRVVVNSFKDKSNADECVKKFKNLGYEPFIIIQ